MFKQGILISIKIKPGGVVLVANKSLWPCKRRERKEFLGGASGNVRLVWEYMIFFLGGGGGW